MRIGCRAFNIYLLFASLCVLWGCASMDPGKPAVLMQFHIESNLDGTAKTRGVPIYREKPFMVNITDSAFLGEGNVEEARVVDTIGGFAIKLKFERRGAWLLESYTTANKGKRIAIFCEFPKVDDGTKPKDKKTAKEPESRWLAAPLIQKPITDGILSFTPDCTRQEAEQIVVELNKLAKKLSSSL